MIALGIDAGGSSSRWLLLDDGREVARGRGAPITGHVFTDADRATTLERIAELCAAVRRHRSPDAVVAGVTGLDRGSDAARLLAGAIAEGLGVPVDRVHVSHDMDVAYRSVFDPGDGVLVYGGTGSIAYRIPSEPGAAVIRIGGHGYLIDDAGGGFWIGHHALRAVLREEDRRGRRPEGPLADAVYARIGDDAWDAVRAHVYGGGRSAVAAFAPDVGSAAAEGDGVAQAILAEAGAELARLALAMFARLGTVEPVALAGGVVHLGDPLYEPFCAALPEGARPTRHVLEPVDAAARLALSASF